MQHNFLQLEIWKRSRLLANQIYTTTKIFPHEEKFGLTSQLRRSAVSIPSNIAEGCGRGTNPQLIHFLNIAIGSICELETQIYIVYNQDYIKTDSKDKLINEITQIRKMTQTFRSKLKIL